MLNYYKPSGAFSPLSFGYVLAISLLVAPILGLAYSYAIWYIPFIYIRFFLTLGFGFAIGFLTNNVVVKYGKVRNSVLAIIFSIFISLVAIYFSWAVWLDLIINAGESYGNEKLGITVSNIEFLQVFSLAGQPSVLFSLMQEVNQVGSITIKTITISGIFLSIIWLIEALMVIGLAIFMSTTQSKKPFCERTGQWFTETILPATELIEDKDKMRADLEKAVPSVFDNLVKNQEIATQSHSIFSLYSSENGENYLSIENKVAKIDDKGKTDFDTEEFIQYIGLSEKMTKTLLEKLPM
jgi:hypothetical protein